MLADQCFVFATKAPKHHFFGYYDKSPLDRTATRLLCLRTDFNDRMPEVDDVAEVGFWTIADREFHKLSETCAFNWQQGSMLQWLGPGFDRYVIFNDRQRDRFVSKIVDTITGESEVIPFPIYTVNPQGNSALSVDFERHYFPREGYAYAGIVRPEKDGKVIEDDGIFRVDFRDKSTIRIVSTRKMYEMNHLTSMEHGPNYLEHLMFNASGERFHFFHRWQLEDGGTFTRIYAANPDGTDIRCLLDSGAASHACWWGDTRILLFAAPPTALNRLRRSRYLVKTLFRPLLSVYHKVFNPGSALSRRLAAYQYLVIQDTNNPTPEPFASGQLPDNGHPSWNPTDDNWLLTDTYEDEENYRWLFLYDYRGGRRIDFGKFFSPPEYSQSPVRCDLHPRWDFGGRYICIDSLHDGSRQMYLFDAASLLSGRHL